jgi:formylglycine-generating enzyme required for sulfatase activity
MDKIRQRRNMGAIYLVGRLSDEHLALVRRLRRAGHSVHNIEVADGDILASLPIAGGQLVPALDQLVSALPPVPESPRLPELINSVGQRLVPIPDGIFRGPSGTLTPICSLLMADFPVTNRQYTTFLDKSGYDGEGECLSLDLYREYDGAYLQALRRKRTGFTASDCPVVCVSWLNAVAFADYITERERESGLIESPWRYRLPLEAEWEYTALLCGDSGAEPNHANFGDAVGHPTPPGTYPANDLGIFDLLGNVFEWCANVADLDRLADVAPRNARGYRANRGGSWASQAISCHPRYRHWNAADTCHDRLGFRLVLTCEAL